MHSSANESKYSNLDRRVFSCSRLRTFSSSRMDSTSARSPLPKYSLYTRPSGSRFGGNAPRFHNSDVNVVFFRTFRTVSRETESTCFSITSRSAKSSKVQLHRPSGGSLQANWINSCSASLSSFTLSGRRGCGRGLTACSIPSVTKR